MPVIAGHGGNTGTQVTTLVVRGLALDEFVRGLGAPGSGRIELGTDRIGGPGELEPATGDSAVLDFGAGVIEDAIAVVVDAAAAGAARPVTEREVGWRAVDRDFEAGRLDPRPGNLRLVIAGCESFAVADPDPIKTVEEEAGREFDGDSCGLGANVGPVSALRKARPILALGQRRTTLAESSKGACRFFGSCASGTVPWASGFFGFHCFAPAGLVVVLAPKGVAPERWIPVFI